jgi:hypothetical protein
MGNCCGGDSDAKNEVNMTKNIRDSRHGKGSSSTNAGLKNGGIA